MADAAGLAGTSRQAARRAVERLVAPLRELPGRRRGRRWEAVGLFVLLDGLEAEYAS